MILPEILPGFFQDFKFLPGFLRDPFRVFFVFVLQDPFLQDSTGLSVIPVGSSSTPWIVSGSFHNAVHLPCTVNGFLPLRIPAGFFVLPLHCQGFIGGGERIRITDELEGGFRLNPQWKLNGKWVELTSQISRKRRKRTRGGGRSIIPVTAPWLCERDRLPSAQLDAIAVTATGIPEWRNCCGPPPLAGIVFHSRSVANKRRLLLWRRLTPRDTVWPHVTHYVTPPPPPQHHVTSPAPSSSTPITSSFVSSNDQPCRNSSLQRSCQDPFNQPHVMLKRLEGSSKNPDPGNWTTQKGSMKIPQNHKRSQKNPRSNWRILKTSQWFL